ncbi:hypothetical protein B0H13DRAFT_2518400 [Mycena leptocephala]|nr:hypothetical protein B0H13DRAFT_2518400 [Mycena leptocephala]
MLDHMRDHHEVHIVECRINQHTIPPLFWPATTAAHRALWTRTSSSSHDVDNTTATTFIDVDNPSPIDIDNPSPIDVDTPPVTHRSSSSSGTKRSADGPPSGSEHPAKIPRSAHAAFKTTPPPLLATPNIRQRPFLSQSQPTSFLLAPRGFKPKVFTPKATPPPTPYVPSPPSPPRTEAPTSLYSFWENGEVPQQEGAIFPTSPVVTGEDDVDPFDQAEPQEPRSSQPVWDKHLRSSNSPLPERPNDHAHTEAGAKASSSSLMTNAHLQKACIVINVDHHIAICQPCGHAIVPDSILRHAKTHGITTLSPEDMAHIQAASVVQGLEKPKLGFVCRGCPYASAMEDTMDRHWASANHKEQCPAAHKREILRRSVQTYWNSKSNQVKWFEVEADMADTAPDDPFALYQDDYGRDLDMPSNILPAPANARMISPLSKITAWDLHLTEWIRDFREAVKLRKLMDTAPLKKNRSSDLGLLLSIVPKYVACVAKINASATTHVRTLLMDCPRIETKPRYFKTHAVQKVIDNYSAPLIAFTHAILRSLEPKPPTTYRFPLTALEKRAATQLRTQLRKPLPDDTEEADKAIALLVPAFHKFIKLFLLERDDDNVLENTELGKFGRVLECLCAVHSMKDDGLLCSPAALTPFLASLKYNIREVLLYEADEIRKQNGGTLEAALTPLALKNLAPGVDSPFIMVTEYQRYISALVFASKRPPNMRVSLDANLFTCEGKTLNLTLFQRGLQKMMTAMEEHLATLLRFAGPDEIPLDLPMVWVDVWSNLERDYSFQREHKWVAGSRPWLAGVIRHSHLIATSSTGGVIRDNSNKVVFNGPVYQQIMDADKKFMELSAAATFLTAFGGRGEQFAEIGLVNDHRPRGLFMGANGECWLAIRRGKVEGQTNAEVFVPSVVPPRIASVLLRYLLVVRPGIAEMLHVHKGAEAGLLAKRQLWVIHGTAVNGTQIGDYMEAATGTFCSIALRPGPWRHIAIELQRIYLGSIADVDQEGDDDIFAARRDHSGATARTHYAREAGGIPTMSPDLTNRYGYASREWHRLLRIDPNEDPVYPVVIGYRHNTSRRATDKEGTVQQPVPADLVKAIVEQAKMVSTVTELVTRLMARQGHRDEFLVPASDLIAQPDSPTVEENAPQTKKLDILQCLRDMLGDPSADWKSNEQKQAVTLAFQRQLRFFGILNTGEGKSFVYQLPAKYDPPGALTVVIVANKALLTDQLASCKRLKIPAMRWTADCPNGDVEFPDDLRIIYVALETAGSQVFRQKVLHQESSRIVRTVYDEIHEGLLNRDWRPDWNKVADLSSQPCQHIYLSATIAIDENSSLTTLLGLHDTVPVVRSQFKQPGIRFAHVSLPKASGKCF